MAWLTSWSYRREITIDNTSNSNNLTDYQVKITLDNTNFDFSKANNDGSDIRFTDDDGSTLLYHWIEKWDSANQEAVIWVKVPSILASSTKTIYMYYGNSSASDASDGVNTFEFFDDFSGDLSKWYISSGSASDTIEITVDNKLYLHEEGSPCKTCQSQDSISGDFILEYKGKSDVGSNYNLGLGIMDSNQSDGNGFFPFFNGNKYFGCFKRTGGSWSNLANTGSWTENTWYNFKIIREGSGFSFYQDESQVGSWSITEIGNSVYIIIPRIWNEETGDAGNLYYDNIRVRKYTDPEPSSSVGNEETIPYYISGQVTLNGNPVQGAKVRCICQDDNSYAGDTTTDTNGNYEITDLDPNKKYHVVVEYTDPDTGQKYNAESKWDITPVEGSS